MDPVRAVDVRTARRPEHRPIPLGATPEAVARRVFLVIGLDLDDPSADSVEEQGCADQLRRDLVDAAREEVTLERARRSG